MGIIDPLRPEAAAAITKCCSERGIVAGPPDCRKRADL